MRPIGLLIAAGVVAVHVAAALAVEPSEEFDTIVRSIRMEREKLKSGVLRIKGTEGSEYARNPDRNKSESFEIFVAFDADHLRFDTREMGYVLHPDTGQPMRGRIERKYLRTKDKIATWASGRRSRVAEPNPPPIGRRKLFDVRTLGIRGWVGRHMSLEETLQALLNHPRVKGVDRSDPKRVQLTLQGGILAGRASDFRIWISPVEGYSATRSEVLTRFKPDEPWKLTQQSNTRWQEAGGTWVPVHHDWSIYSDKQRKFLDFDLEWESINKPIDPKWFEIESLGPDAKVESVDEQNP